MDDTIHCGMDSLELTILEHMYRHNLIGGKHTAIENASKGVPKHMRGAAESAVKKLIKEGWILPKPTNYGLQISLNPGRIREIRAAIGEDL